MSKIIRGQTIELDPTNKQVTHFLKACGVARFAYNWALAQWQRQYQSDKYYKDQCKRLGLKVNKKLLHNPTQGKLRKQLNAIKKEQFSYMYEVTKCAPQLAIMQLGVAFSNFFAGRAGYPKFRRRGMHDRFSLDNISFEIENNKIKIPNLGWVRMKEKLRLNGKLMNATIFTRGGKWFVSIGVEIDKPQPLTKTGKSVGIDLGVIHLAMLSNGEAIRAHKALRKNLKKLRRLSKSLSRKELGSANRAKAKAKLSRLHYKISCIRKDYLHKLTTRLVREYDIICIEDLNIKGMMKNRRLARAIGEVGFHEFKRQLIYKAEGAGRIVKSVDRFYPSSKTCSGCGEINKELKLSQRSWTCPCGADHDRDVNAAKNILQNADKVLTAA